MRIAAGAGLTPAGSAGLAGSQATSSSRLRARVGPGRRFEPSSLSRETRPSPTPRAERSIEAPTACRSSGKLAAGRPIHYGAGFSGNGVVPSLLAGRILASLALGRDDEWSQCGLARGVPGRFPAEPVRSLGGALVRRAVGRKERLEDTGRGVDAITARLAALAPSGFFKAGAPAAETGAADRAGAGG